MKISALRTLIKEAINDMEVSLELSNGKIIHGLARKDPKALSLQIGSNTYFSFWEGKFILSGTGDVTIVGGVDDYSQEWFLKATEEYLKAMEDAYPEKFKYNTTGPIGINESTSGVDYISVKIKKDGNFLKQVKGKVKPTDIGFIIYNEKNDDKPYNIIWDKKRNKFINGETIWYNVEDVIPDLGYEEDFIKLERPFI